MFSLFLSDSLYEFVSRLSLAPMPRLWWNQPCVSRDAHAPDLFGIGAINNSMDGVGRPYDAHRANLLEYHHQPTNAHRKEGSIYYDIHTKHTCI